MQTQATSLVSFSVQTPPTGAGRSNSSSDKAFAACLSDKQQASNGSKTDSQPEVKTDAATPVKKGAPQDDKQQTSEDTTTSSTSQTGTADQQQPVAAQQQPDASADIALRMAVFTPVNGLVQIANATAANKNNAATVVNVQAVNASANSAMSNMTSVLAMPQDGQLPQGFSGALAQVGAAVATANNAQAAEGLPQQMGTVPSNVTNSKAANAKTDALPTVFNGQGQAQTAETLSATEGAAVQETVVSALNQQPITTAAQTVDTNAIAEAAAPATVKSTAASQQTVQATATGVVATANAPQPQTARLSNAENVQTDEPQNKTEMPLDSIKAVGASKEQTEAKQGQQAGKEKLPTDAGTTEISQEKTTDVNPLNYSSVKSSVEVVTHSGAAVDKQNAVQANAVLSQVADQVRLTHRPGADEMIMHLKPEQLGDVTVKLLMEGGRLTARFHADNPEVRIVLENSLQQLKQDLTSAGIKVHDVGVYAGLDNPLGQQGERGQAWAGMTGNGNSSRKAEAMSETLIQELEQQSSITDSDDAGVDYRV